MEIKTIKIISAHELSKSQKVAIEEAVAKKHSEKVELVYEISEKVIGGLKVEDGYEVFDATVQSKIASVKKQIR